MTTFPIVRATENRLVTTWTSRALCALALFWLALAPAVAQQINEIQVSTTGADWEFVEFFHSPSTSLAGLTLIEIEGDVGSPIGRVDAAIALTGSTSATGFYLLISPTGASTYGVTGDQSMPDNTLENSTATYLLVSGWSGAVGNDLDTNDDGVFDTTPWTSIVDSVGLRDSGAGDVVYSVNDLGPDGSFLPSGGFRSPDGGPWSPIFLNFSTPDGTPGRPNSVVINEIQVSTTGADWEFVEFFTAPSTSLAGLTLIEIEGDVGSPIGRVDAAIALTGSTSATGFYLLISPTGASTYGVTGDQSMPDNTLENSTATYLLVSGWSGAVGNDLDTNDDGVFDTTPWTAIFDSVGLRDSGAGDVVYSVNDLGPDGSFLPSGAERLPDGGPWSPIFLNFGTPDGTPGATNGAPPPPTITPIHDIQGPGASSPLVGTPVTTEGIVTGVRSNGFYLQEPDATIDADPATSEGIFVFTSGAPPADAALGNGVRVSGTVAEFVPSADPLQPPLTELTAPTVSLLSSGNPLPTPIPLTSAFPSPAGAHDQLERIEGMRVSVASLTVVGATLGSISEPNATATSNGVFYGVVTGNARPFREAGIQAPDPAPAGTIPPIPRFDANPERIRVDSDGLVGGALADVKSDDLVLNLVGPLDYTFRTYTILPDPGSFSVSDGGRTPSAVTTPASFEVTVATYNLQRFFDTVDDPATSDPVLTPAAFDARLGKASLGIRDYLRTPDVVAVNEVENLPTLQAIAARISADAVAAAQPDPQYQALLVEGNDIGGIDVGFLVKSAPVAPAVPRVEVIAVTQVGAATLLVNPDASTELLNDRPPLVLEAVVHHPNGASFPLTAIVVHQRSLGGVADLSPGPNGWATVGDRVRNKRQKQAEFLAGVLQARQSVDPAEHIVVLGDFNGFEVNDGLVDVMGVSDGTPVPDAETAVPGDGIDLVSPDFVNLFDTPPAPERYSYVFDGNAQSLDHVLIDAALVADTLARRIEHPRINADFPVVARNDFSTATRLADHDPIVGFFAVEAFLSADLSVTKSDAPDPVIAGTNLVYTVTVTNAGPDAAANPSWSDTLPAGTTFVSLVTPGGWSCTTPAVGSGGTVSCSTASLGVGSAVFTLTVQVDVAFGAGVLVSNTAATTSATADVDLANNTATSSTTVLSPATVSATKSVAGAFIPGSLVTYTVVLANSGPATQVDNPGDEFVDALPAELTLIGASASSGTAFADLGTNTVTWNGSIPPGGTVTIVIDATIDYGVADGTVISNQGFALYDADGNGTNEATAPTDDPATGTPDDPTDLVVSAPAIQEIPTLDAAGLALLALLLAGFAAARLRRAPR